MKRNRRKRISIKKIFVILLCLLLVLFLVRFTYSRYQTQTNSNGELDIAFYLLKEDYKTMNIKLDAIQPRTDPYVYNFSVSNTDGTNRAETNLTYDLTIVTTTNLPLTYELYMNNSNAILTNEVAQDGDETYFRTIKTSTQELDFNADKTNLYTLKVYFPTEYKTINYQDIIESVEVQVSSKQKIS